MKINWKVRIKSKTFWVSMIALILLLIQAVAKVFGIAIDFGELGNNLKEVVNIVFMILAAVGITVDPTTEGLSDSNLAMTYTVPKKDGE